MQGKVGGRTWKMELGRPTRDYIAGEELRARAELGVFDEVGAMIINRPLKDALERRAYSMITDTLQTTADPRLPEEMRWLAMYDEVGWEGPSNAFWTRYAVLSDKREHALAWVDDHLVKQLMSWPQPATLPTVPFMIVLLRGKCYLRMQYLPGQHAGPATGRVRGRVRARWGRSGNEKRPAGLSPRLPADAEARGSPPLPRPAVGAVLAQLPLGDRVAVHLVRAVRNRSVRACA